MPSSPEGFYAQHEQDAKRVDDARNVLDQHSENAKSHMTEHYGEYRDQASAEYQQQATDRIIEATKSGDLALAEELIRGLRLHLEKKTSGEETSESKPMANKAPEKFYNQHHRDAERLDKAKDTLDKHLQKSNEQINQNSSDYWDQASTEYRHQAKDRLGQATKSEDYAAVEGLAHSLRKHSDTNENFEQRRQLAEEIALRPESVLKTNYHLVEKLETEFPANIIKTLNDGRIVSVDRFGRTNIISIDQHGTFKIENSMPTIARSLDIDPENRMIEGDAYGKISIFKEDESGWKNEVVGKSDFPVLIIKSLPDGRIISVDDHGHFKIWQKDGGEWSDIEIKRYVDDIEDLQVLPNNQILVHQYYGLSLLEEGESGFWREKEMPKISRIDGEVTSLPDGKIAYISYEGSVCLADPNSMQEEQIGRFEGATRAIRSLSEKQIVTGSAGGRITILSRGDDNLWTEEEIYESSGTFLDLQTTPDGKIIISNGDSIEIFDGEPVEK